MIASFYFISLLFAFVYIFIITHILTAWNEIEEWDASDSFKTDVTISIVIPFRNEAANLAACIESIIACNYPKSKYEIILVNDHSEDSGKEVLSQFLSTKIKLISLDQVVGKKEAIKAGVSVASGKLIITTDADCTVGKNWLRQISSYYTYTKKAMIVGMVALEGRETVLEYFQIMDTCGTMGLHGAGIHNKTHFLANGANLIFEKTLFEALNPFQENQYASGDDVFFVNKVAIEAPESIGFLKNRESVIETQAETSWSGLWKQRRRWATKNNAFSKGIYRWMTGAIWLLSLSIIVNVILIPFTGAFTLFIALTQLLIKGIMDFLFLQNMCKYFDKSKVLKYFIPAFLVQTFYIFAIGIVALIGGKSEWKGRIQH